MRYLLDTCTVSEFTKPRPETRVIEWMNAIDELKVCVSAATIGELQRGISLLPPSNKRVYLEGWLQAQLTTRFINRVLPLDEDIFRVWGSLVARLRLEGHPIGVFDSLIAATAIHHRLTLATRNTNDFLHVGISLFNPWEE